MGWKSTVDITREEAIKLVFSRLSTVHMMSDRELCGLLDQLGYGEDTNLPYYGHNFMIREKEEDDNEF